MGEYLKLKWHQHLSFLQEKLDILRLNATYTDATIACEGKLYPVHRLVLASCSPFFDHIFQQTPGDNTVIVLNETPTNCIELLIDYMYRGEIQVPEDYLGQLLKTANCLEIRGLGSPILNPKSELNQSTLEGDNNFKELSKDQQTNAKRRGSVSMASSEPKKRKLNTNNSQETPVLANLFEGQWNFQAADLPNATWSSSQHKNEIKKTPAAPCQIPKTIQYHDYVTRVSSACPRKGIKSQHTVINSQNSTPSRTPASTIIKQEIMDEIEHQEMSKSLPDLNPRNVKFAVKNRKIAPLQMSNQGEELNQGQLLHGYQTMQSNNTLNSIPISQSVPIPLIKSSTIRTGTTSVWDTQLPTTTSLENLTSTTAISCAHCSNCNTSNTRLWRRSAQGNVVCNACGLYYKLHGVDRPAHLFRSVPMTRRRHPRKKKKDGEEEASDSGDQSFRGDEITDNFHARELTDPEHDHLAVLNAALTLNSLFANSHANSNANAGAWSTSHPSSPASNSQVRSDSVERTAQSRPPPPGLLKLNYVSIPRTDMSSRNSTHSSTSPDDFDRSPDHLSVSDDEEFESREAPLTISMLKD